MKKKVYLAGPMTGIPDLNTPAFEKVYSIWEDAGWQVFSPSRLNHALDYSVGISKDGLKHVIQTDITCILHVDAIALLPGWENSRGVAIELALAQFLDLPIYDAMTAKRIYPNEKPWNK